MMKLTVLETDEIKNCIKANELRTDCEIVPMIISESDHYHVAHHRMSLTLSIVLFLVVFYSSYSFINPIYYLAVQLVGLMLGHFLAYLPTLKRFLLSKEEMHRETEQRAYEAFVHHNIHSTPNQLGMLIFISLLERRIILITDIGIKNKIDQKLWDELVLNFVSGMKGHGLKENTISLINGVTDVLEKYFPRTSIKSTNALNDDLLIK